MKALTIVAVRILALFIILNAVAFFPFALGIAMAADEGWNTLLYTGARLTIGLLVFCYSDRIGSAVVRGLSSESAAVLPAADAIERIAVTVLGLAVTISALPQLVPLIWLLIGGTGEPMMHAGMFMLPENIHVGDSLAVVVQTASGLWLWLCPDQVMSLGRCACSGTKSDS